MRYALALLAALAMSGCVDGGGPPAAPDASGSTVDSGPVVDASAPSVDGAVDGDGDGVPLPADCDDTNRAIYPGAVEDCSTPVDEDCDALTDLDPDCDADIDEDVDEDTDEDVDEDDDDEVDEE